jgi:hypothetical protein
MQAGRASQLLASLTAELQQMAEPSLFSAMVEQMLFIPKTKENLFVLGRPRVVGLLDAVLGSAASCCESASKHWLPAQHAIVYLANTCMHLTGQLQELVTAFATILVPKAQPPAMLHPDVQARALSGLFDAVLAHYGEADWNRRPSMDKQCDLLCHGHSGHLVAEGACLLCPEQ